MKISDMFIKPEIPVEVRVSDAFVKSLDATGVSASRAIKLAAYALLCADTDGLADIRHVLGTEPLAEKGRRRMTVRIPVRVHDEIQSRMAPLTVAGALSKMARLYEDNPESLAHV